VSPNDPDAARAYHERTKHSLESVRSNPHGLAWDIQPLPFKIYSSIEPIPLPRDLGPVDMPTLQAISSSHPRSERERVVPSVAALARILHYSAGITKERVHAGGQRFYFRAAACTGALYHIDLYLICGDLPGLPAGVYHFGPHDFALRRLRAGDHRRALVDATAAEPSIAHAPVVVACTSTFWRNAWKYQARAYRHCWWDSGTLLAHLLATATAERVPARVVLGFVDRDVNALLGLDTLREVTLGLVSLGHDPQAAPPALAEIAPLAFATAPLSRREVDYPAIREMHEASSLPDADSVRAWRDATDAAQDGSETSKADDTKSDVVPLEPMKQPPNAPLDRTIIDRGSTRRFAHEPISFEQLSTILESSVAPVSFDFRPAPARALDDVYLIVNAMDGLAPGSYALLGPHERDGRPGLSPLRTGSFRREAGYLGLGQDLSADAAVDAYFLTSLDRVLARYGARGYRAAQLEAAIHGGRMYLASYAMSLGATGLTFFDDDVTSFFSPHAGDKAVMFLVAIGKPRRRTLRVA
jgi:SagB-type dehydrogenase family enzyme